MDEKLINIMSMVMAIVSVLGKVESRVVNRRVESCVDAMMSDDMRRTMGKFAVVPLKELEEAFNTRLSHVVFGALSRKKNTAIRTTG
ncbi:hypothetical protein KKA53_01975 [Candidatus Dependentiae bacterium]|nr:hypothetical protein [Candidatus Dependentiae bacterium]